MEENVKVKMKINISGEITEIEISVNKEGNLVLDNIGSVCYEMFENELILSKFAE